MYANLTKLFEIGIDKYHNKFENKYLFLSTITLFFCSLSYLYLKIDPDLFARLAVGRLIEEVGYLPLSDVFAYTPKKELWIDHEWLSGWIFYRIWNLFGDKGIYLFKLAIFTYTILTLYRASIIENKSTSFTWFTFCIFNSWVIWKSTLRSQVFTYFFLSFFIYSFTSYKNKHESRNMFLLPFIMIIWANSHGGFIVGLGYLFLFTFADIIKNKRINFFLAIISCLCLFTTLINPYGFAYWKYILEATTMKRVNISEWDSLSLSTPELWPFIITISAIALVWLKNKTILTLEGALFILVSTYFAYKHIRLGAIFYFTALVYATEIFVLLKDMSEKSITSLFLVTRRSLYLLIFVFSLLSIILLANNCFRFSDFKLDYHDYPVLAFDWLKSNRSGGNVLVDFNNGSYALYELYPNFKISLDGRYEELYTEKTLYLVDCALHVIEQKHQDCFHQVYPDFILLDATSYSANNYQLFGSEWEIIYNDSKYNILGRRYY